MIDAARMGELVVIIYEYMAKKDHFASLAAFDLDGLVWTAEYPNTASTDAFAYIPSTNPLRVGNFIGCDRRVDLESGRLL